MVKGKRGQGEAGRDVTVQLKGLSLSVAQGTVNASAFRPLPDDHPCYALIGLIASESARVEHFLDAAIFDFIGLQSDAKLGAFRMGQMVGMYPRYQALRQLALERGAPKPIITEIERQISVSSNIAEKRARAIHDAWMEDMFSKDPYQFRTKSKKVTDYGPQPITIDNLKDDLAAVRRHLERAMKLRSDIWEFHRSKP